MKTSRFIQFLVIALLIVTLAGCERSIPTQEVGGASNEWSRSRRNRRAQRDAKPDG